MTAWHPVALAEGLEPGSSAGTRLFGRELVVWRDAAGRAHVWEDRCPHRGMRLSFGFVRGERIACLYHGWQFDGSGRCSHIPAHPALNVPGTIRATVYPCAEHLGIVWVGPADAVGAPPGAAAVTVPVRSLAVRVPAAETTAALMTAQDAPFPGAIRVEALGELIVLRVDGEALYAAVQPVSDTESTVHLTIHGNAGIHGGAGQARVSAWAEALRRRVERPR